MHNSQHPVLALAGSAVLTTIAKRARDCQLVCWGCPGPFLGTLLLFVWCPSMLTSICLYFPAKAGRLWSPANSIWSHSQSVHHEKNCPSESVLQPGLYNLCCNQDSTTCQPCLACLAQVLTTRPFNMNKQATPSLPGMPHRHSAHICNLGWCLGLGLPAGVSIQLSKAGVILQALHCNCK